jgi:parvulin-like peptidyl-prolyl isomerase
MVELQIVQTQASKNHIFASKKEIDDAYKKVVDESGGEAEVEKVLEELYGMNKKDFLQLVKEQVIKDKVREGLLVQIKARHILVRDDARAKEALDKVKAGGNFEDLAKEYSEDTASRDKGGDLGWFGRGTMVKEFEDAAFKLKPGETSELVKTEYGNHIIRVEDRKGKIDKSYDDWINEVRDKAKIIKFIR